MINELSSLLSVPKLASQMEAVDRSLVSVVTSAANHIRTPLKRVFQHGGKRLRPILVLAIASLGSPSEESIINAATAIELAHLASIIHDDVIDHAAERWGQPTINSHEGVESAILVGDYLLAQSGMQAASVSQEVAALIALAFASMCEGQAHETADKYQLKRSVDDYLSTIRQKTGALMSAACVAGGLLAKLPEPSLKSLDTYGEAFGMSFQLTDDLLDILSTSELMGKPVGNDIKEGVYTLPVLLALSDHSQAMTKLLKSPSNQLRLIDALVSSGSINKTTEKIKQENIKASQAIRRLGDNPIITGLSDLPTKYYNWAMKKQTTVPRS